MKNILSYYYELYPNEISHIKDKYFFEYKNLKYVFEKFNRPLSDAKCLYNINKLMVKKGILVHEIILNNQSNILTYVNNEPFILMEININENAKINLAEICHINNNSVDITCDKLLDRYDWANLWEAKNDYFEAQINEIGKKYPNLCNYANYYIGLAENAIFYVKSAIMINEPMFYCICHKRIDYDESLYFLYHPMNFIRDYRIRDVCEYIKSAFFKDKDAYILVEEFLNHNYLSYKEALFFYGRLLYPSYFFDLYDDIVNNNLNENLIENIIVKSKEYEMFLFHVNNYLEKLFNRYFPKIDWITKRSFF